MVWKGGPRAIRALFFWPPSFPPRATVSAAAPPAPAVAMGMVKWAMMANMTTTPRSMGMGWVGGMRRVGEGFGLLVVIC